MYQVSLRAIAQTLDEAEDSDGGLNLMFANKVLSVAEASVWDFLAQEAPAPALEDLRETMSLAIQ